ncbi:MAG TPA: serine hydrolase [Edaphocola sp.]|nr:serine hydrolase [Edaphocola sp.]
MRKMIIHPEYLHALDSFMELSIRKGAFPGCQVFAAVNGNIIYQESFGHYTYDSSSPPVTDSTLFDIASVTKIMATTLSVMKLAELGKIDLDSSLNAYLPELVGGTNKQGLKIRDLLLHQAGLVAWIPFYKNTLDSLTGKPRTDLYRQVAEKDFNIPVAADLYLRNDYVDTIWKTIINSPLDNLGRYVYSDLDFYFLQKVVEKVGHQSLAEFVAHQFYKPLGLHHILYDPWRTGRIKDCAPTEKDTYFRYQLLQGYVHDQGAAMLGGVAGHAGLFATATDIGTVMQMLLNGGIYHHHRFFERTTVLDFTSYRSDLSRRGLGFDKPVKEGKGGPASDYCSKSAFGHQGFTGTCAWADPESGVVFVLLTNRVYPTADNWLITDMNIRTIAQGYIYRALGYGQ